MYTNTFFSTSQHCVLAFWIGKQKDVAHMVPLLQPRITSIQLRDLEGSSMDNTSGSELQWIYRASE